MGKTLNKREKLTNTLLIITILLVSSVVPFVYAVLPDPISEDYRTEYGVLDSDTYILYPYEETSIDVGFSKYGEMIDGDMGLGLKYDGVDVFANSAVPKKLWCNGWVMDIHYTQGGNLRNTWAYALFSMRDPSSDPNLGVEGDWQNYQESKDASAFGDTPGGRRTNGFAITDDIRLIYEGPRKVIYLLNTTIFDKNPGENGTPLVELTIQLVFDKVSKNVMEIKDVKRIDDNKMNGPFQIEFSQRAEWDVGLGDSSPQSYAEFYSGLPTKYHKHPFYSIPGHTGTEATFDLCQIISASNNPSDPDLVGYAAYWPPLISKWVQDSGTVRQLDEEIDVPSLLKTSVTYDFEKHLPEDKDILVSGVEWLPDNEVALWLPRESVEYPRGMGQWSHSPWLFKWVDGEWAKILEGDDTSGAWYWDPSVGPHGSVVIRWPTWDYEDSFKVIFKREMDGQTLHTPEALECMEPMFEPGEVVDSYGMVGEPQAPYVFAEWDFDLSMDDKANSTQQFRCVSVYGVTDYNNAVDPDQDPGDEFRIDSEVQYQLNQIFNPIDLKDAAHKDTFRWAQKGDMDTTITLESHLHDKYGNDRTCLEDVHQVWVPEKWGYYCQDSEKVLAYTSSGAVLLERDDADGPNNDDYTIDGNVITILEDYGADTYKVLYTTILLPPELTLDETDFAKRKESTTMFGADVKREFLREGVLWTIDFDETDIEGHWASGADLIIKGGCKLFKIRSSNVEEYFKLWDDSITNFGDAMPLPEGIEIYTESQDTSSTDPDYWEIFVPYKYLGGKCFEWAAYLEASWPGHSSSEQMIFPKNWGGLPDDFSWYTPELNMYPDGSCWSAGRWEWTVLGESSLPSDSLGATMISSAWSDWKNVQCWLSGLDIQSEEFAPSIPTVLRKFAEEPTVERYYHDYPEDMRLSFRDDWCTPDGWDGDPTIYPYAVSSSNIQIIGGPEANMAAEYSNDFTDALIYTEYGPGFYGPGCWARTTQPYYEGYIFQDVEKHELWYNSVDVDDDVGHAMVSVFKDLNETTGLVVYGYTAEDTYYACYALRGGLLDWMQHLQDGVTTLIIEIDYTDLHPVKFHVKESLGVFTECTGFGTDFKCMGYKINKDEAQSLVEARADCLGLCYKLIDIEWCAQLHPDP